MSSALEKMKSGAEKLKALKCQLNFHKKVLEQSGPKELFFFYEQEQEETQR